MTYSRHKQYGLPNGHTGAVAMAGEQRSGLMPYRMLQMMNEIVQARKRGTQKSDSVLRICNIGWRARNRIEQRKQEKTRHKTADMRFPGDVGAFHADPDRSNAENEVHAEPDDEEGDHAAIAQRLPEGLRGHLGGAVRIAPAERKKTAAHER